MACFGSPLCFKRHEETGNKFDTTDYFIVIANKTM